MAKIWGLRWDDREFGIGEELPKSYRWDMGSETDEELNGTCAILVSDESDFLDYLDGAIESECGEMEKYNKWIRSEEYAGSHLYLVAIDTNWGWEYGEDEDEVVMCGAEVIRILK